MQNNLLLLVIASSRHWKHTYHCPAVKTNLAIGSPCDHSRRLLTISTRPKLWRVLARIFYLSNRWEFDLCYSIIIKILWIRNNFYQHRLGWLCLELWELDWRTGPVQGLKLELGTGSNLSACQQRRPPHSCCCRGATTKYCHTLRHCPSACCCVLGDCTIVVPLDIDKGVFGSPPPSATPQVHGRRNGDGYNLVDD